VSAQSGTSGFTGSGVTRVWDIHMRVRFPGSRRRRDCFAGASTFLLGLSGDDNLQIKIQQFIVDDVVDVYAVLMLDLGAGLGDKSQQNISDERMQSTCQESTARYLELAGDLTYLLTLWQIRFVYSF
jgi:hypothetical protein